MNPKRILYFDAIKLIAVIFVFVCHFARTLEYYQISYSLKLLPDNIFSVYTGSVGCALFFIVSGASLFYVYQDNLDLKTYFIKRIKGIYPMFWISFVIFFCIQFYIDGGYNSNIPISRSLLTLIGFDGTMAYFYSTFYTVGEWFLGILIIMYLIFPILKKWVDEFPYATFLVCYMGGIILDYLCDDQRTLFFEWIPFFVFGMVFYKCIRKVNGYILFGAMVILAIFTVFDLKSINNMIRAYFVCTAFFLILVYLFENFNGSVFIAVSRFVGRFCYPIFLVHHRLMLIFMKKFSNSTFYKGDVICMFIFMIMITLIVSYFLDKLTSSLLAIWRK
ncbi:MAG: acyltransferase [Lachnospiraceae bacterium]|nr:acyltransferase [Lachnospiraceae bacterium]